MALLCPCIKRAWAGALQLLINRWAPCLVVVSCRDLNVFAFYMYSGLLYRSKSKCSSSMPARHSVLTHVIWR